MTRATAIGICFFGLAQLSAAQLPPPGTVSGRVLSSGSPVRHARVSISGISQGTATTNAQGEFHFENLRPGNYFVRAEKPGFLVRTVETTPGNFTAPIVRVSPSRRAAIDVQMDRGAAMEGVVVTSTGEPLSRSSLLIVGDRIANNSDNETDAVLRVNVGHDGRFRLHTLPAGKYLVWANFGNSGPGDWYFPGTSREDEARTITLGAGEDVHIGAFMLPSGVELPAMPIPSTMPRNGTGAIEGRVFDEFGDPAPWVSVQLLRRQFIAGRFRLVPSSDFSRGPSFTYPTWNTDDVGRFRMDGLTSGDYYLVALPGAYFRPPTGTSAVSWPPGLTDLTPTYFPDALDSAHAAPVRVRERDVVSDISIMLQPAQTGRLVLYRPGYTGPLSLEFALATLSSRFHDRWLHQVQRGELVPATGLRVLSGLEHTLDLPAGEYALTSGERIHTIVISPGSTEEMELETTAPSTTVSGRVSVEDGSGSPFSDQLVVRLVPTDLARPLALPTTFSVPVSRDRTFLLVPQAATGVVRVDAPKGWAVKRVTVGDRDVTDVPVEFHPDRGVIDVQLTSRTGAVAGRVLDAGRPSIAHSVILFADDGARWAYPSRFIHVGRMNGQGSFEIAGVLPGRYLALPLPNNTDEGADPEWLEAMRPQAVPVAVTEGETARIDVPVR